MWKMPGHDVLMERATAAVVLTSKLVRGQSLTPADLTELTTTYEQLGTAVGDLDSPKAAALSEEVGDVSDAFSSVMDGLTFDPGLASGAEARLAMARELVRQLTERARMHLPNLGPDATTEDLIDELADRRGDGWGVLLRSQLEAARDLAMHLGSELHALRLSELGRVGAAKRLGEVLTEAREMLERHHREHAST